MTILLFFFFSHFTLGKRDEPTEEISKASVLKSVIKDKRQTRSKGPVVVQTLDEIGYRKRKAGKTKYKLLL